MARTYSLEMEAFELSDEQIVFIDYEMQPGSPASGMYGPPEDYDPGESPYVDSYTAWVMPASSSDWLGFDYCSKIKLSQEDYERFEERAITNFDPDYDDQPDDDWRYDDD